MSAFLYVSVATFADKLKEHIIDLASLSSDTRDVVLTDSNSFFIKLDTGISLMARPQLFSFSN